MEQTLGLNLCARYEPSCCSLSQWPSSTSMIATAVVCTAKLSDRRFQCADYGMQHAVRAMGESETCVVGSAESDSLLSVSEF